MMMHDLPTNEQLIKIRIDCEKNEQMTREKDLWTNEQKNELTKRWTNEQTNEPWTIKKKEQKSKKRTNDQSKTHEHTNKLTYKRTPKNTHEPILQDIPKQDTSIQYKTGLRQDKTRTDKMKN